jgi:hypothetical protein
MSAHTVYGLFSFDYLSYIQNKKIVKAITWNYSGNEIWGSHGGDLENLGLSSGM